MKETSVPLIHQTKIDKCVMVVRKHKKELIGKNEEVDINHSLGHSK